MGDSGRETAYPRRPLVGCGHALRTMGKVLDDSANGAFHFLSLVGEPGAGKTRLLGELAASAHDRGLPVFSGSASEFEQELPFGAFVDALDDAVAEGLPGLVPDLGPTALRQLAMVFPALSASHTGDHDDRDAGHDRPAGLVRYRLYGAVRDLIERLAVPNGLVLVLDDLHWADDSSVELVNHLVRHPPRAGVLIAVSCRPAQVGPALTALLRTAAEHGPSLTVAPLTLDEAAEFLGPDVSRARREALYEASGGNPFYLDALARMASTGDHDAPPHDVKTTIRAELNGLSESLTLVAQAAAIAADEFDPALVAAAAGTTVPDTLTALDRLAARDVVRPAAGGVRFRFRHPLIRHVIYDSTPPARRPAAHARVAAHLAGLGVPAAQLAHHVERSASHGDRAAVETLITAARSVSLQAPHTAAVWFASALRLMPHEAPERLTLMIELAELQCVSGRLEEGRETATEVLRLLPAGDHARRSVAVRLSAITQRLLGRFDQSHALLLNELAAIPDQRSEAATRLRVRLISDMFLKLDRRAALDELALVPEPENGWHPSLGLSLHALRSMADYVRGAVDEALAGVRAADEILAAAPDDDIVDCLDALTWLGWTECLMGLHAGAVRHFDRLMDVAQATGRQYVIPVALAGKARSYLRLGRLVDAARTVAAAAESARLLASPQQRVFVYTEQCLVDLWSGDVTAALAGGRAAVQTSGEIREWWGRQAQYAYGLALVHADRPDEGRELLAAVCRSPGPVVLDPDTILRSAVPLAALDAANGRPEEAARWADRAAACAHPRLPGTVGLSALARAYALGHTDPGAAAAKAREAAEALAAAELRLDTGQALLTAGVAAARAGDREPARESLEAAVETFGECGAHLLSRRAVRELRRLGVPASPGPSATPYGLSRRELEVANLVAKGRTSSQIAESLIISVRAVESHLCQVFAKLGVTSRAGVAAAVHRAENSV
ncbi:regulatory LuxR family protein [Actinomadura pelletieri DSM 43383]|uniref:Regulatory LuxR family protein n=2 Tax=Actinomadura pelletieri TaxID=111805 RepID=A0A495QA35_9ACTN|nr:LuxR family transcriptional regulator [Actinomadura pelletieri]RKS68378.1 regulatory LuxR family protein [Actinomadura pelletieri DSM 43383]